MKTRLLVKRFLFASIICMTIPYSNCFTQNEFYVEAFKVPHLVTCEEQIAQINKLDALRKQPKYSKAEYQRSFLFIAFPFLTKCEEYSLAEQYGEELLKVLPKEDPQYWEVLKALGTSSKLRGHVFKAEKYFIRAQKHLPGRNIPLEKQAALFNQLGEVLHSMGQLAESERQYLEILEKTKNDPAFPVVKRAVIRGNLALLYHDLGQYDKAKRYIEMSLKVINKEEQTKLYVNLISILASILERKDLEKAGTLYREAVEVEEKVAGPRTLSMAHALNNLGYFLTDIGNYEKAEEHLLDVCEIVLEKSDSSHQLYTIALNNLGAIYGDMGRIEEAKEYYLKSLQLDEKVIGAYHPSYATTASNLARLYWEEGKFKAAKKYFQLNINNLSNQLKYIYPVLSEKEKLNFLDNKLKVYLQDYFSFINQVIKKYPNLAGEGLNLLLNTQGMALKTGLNLREQVIQTDDRLALGEYDRWLRLRKLINQTILNQHLGLDSLTRWEQEAEALEKSLSRRLNGVTDQFQKEVQWQDLRAELKEDEVAIAFVNYRTQTKKNRKGSREYAAIVLTRSMKRPKWIRIGDEKKLLSFVNYKNVKDKAAYFHDIDASHELYNLIWKPIRQRMGKNKMTLISTSGVLNRIALHLLMDESGQFMGDIYDLRQFATLRDVIETRNLSRKRSENKDRLVSFAGVDFDTKIPQEDFQDNSEKGISERRWTPLPGTTQESNQIIALFQEYKWVTQQYVGKLASEQKFKALSGNSPRILHLATHGFFLPDVNSDKWDGQQQHIDSKPYFEIVRQSDKPLMRIGLAFAGANQVWSSKDFSTNEEDGILNGYEIVNCDLQQTDLVILSACDTGLGDSKDYEGVLGLQRAFKLAGVDKVLMSLWPIEDASTATLISTFGKHYLELGDVYKALKKTRQELDNNNFEPYFWGGFILVE